MEKNKISPLEYDRIIREIDALQKKKDESLRANNELDESIRVSQVLLYDSMIKSLERELSSVVVIRGIVDDNEIILLGDNVTISIQYDNEKPRDYTLTLSDRTDMANGLINIDSPIGNTIFGKKAGYSCNCKTPKGTATINIISKNLKSVLKK